MNKQLLKFIILSLVLFLNKYSAAQSNITFDAGQVFSTFKFIDSQGIQEKNFTNNITGCFSLGYQYKANNGLFIRSNLGMRKGGASLIFNEIDFKWNVQYADAAIGVGYMINKWRLKPYFSASPYFAYMLKGEQTFGPSIYDIKKNKSMASSDYGLYFSPGLKIALSNYVSFYAEYKYILGLQNLEKSANQTSFNRGFSINLGVSITIIKYSYATAQ